jgi:hypothetical protein
MDMRLFRKWSERLTGAVMVECGYQGQMQTWFCSSDPYVRRERRWVLRAWKLASFVPQVLRVSCRLFSPSGLLILRRRSATDRRAREIAITPKGRRLLRRARGLISQVEDEVLAGLTVEERLELLTLLRRALDSAPAQPLWSSEEGD